MALKNVIFLFILYQFKFDGRCSLLWRLQLDFKILKTCKIHINCQGWKVKKFERWKWKMIFWFLFLGLSFDKWYSAKVETDPINKQSKHHLVITNKRFWERTNIFFLWSVFNVNLCQFWMEQKWMFWRKTLQTEYFTNFKDLSIHYKIIQILRFVC